MGYPETHPDVLEFAVRESMRRKDRNGDGRLDLHEFWEADREAGYDDGALTEEEIIDFKKLDLNGDGVLEKDEVTNWESGRFHVHESMKKLFDLADSNSDMHISADELIQAREAVASSDAQYHLVEWADHAEL